MDHEIKISAFKHNHVLYKIYKNCKLVLENDDQIIVNLNKTSVEEKYKANWIFKERALWFFPKNKWFNFIWYQDQSKFNYYINISKPFIFEDNQISYVDYDLDIKVYNDFSYNILDFKEFNRNRMSMHYNSKIIESIWNAVDSLKKMINKKELWFNLDHLNNLLKNKDLKNG